MIAEATSMLDEDDARAVQDKVLPAAGDRTTAQLRAVLRRAVTAADPDGAEHRRGEAERRAKVSLYADDEGTATLTGQNMPAILAAAAHARITALAKARPAPRPGNARAAAWHPSLHPPGRGRTARHSPARHTAAWGRPPRPGRRPRAWRADSDRR